MQDPRTTAVETIGLQVGFSYEQANIVALAAHLFHGSRRTTDEEYDAIKEAFRGSLRSTTTRKNRR